MKIDNKQITIILVSVAVISLFLVYFAKAVTYKYVSGYMVLLDQAALLENKEMNTYSNSLFLPSDNCEGFAVGCSYIFSSDIDSTLDINKDGKIDYVDLKLVSGAFGCSEKLYTGAPNPCWEEKVTVQECYFSYTGGFFKEPSGDCYINKTDIDMIAKYYGAANVPSSNSSDINKDGIIDMMDIAIVARSDGKYADYFRSYVIKKKDADLNKDGMVDMTDISRVARDFGQVANIQGCVQTPITSIGGNKWKVSVSGIGLYHVGVSYKCQVEVSATTCP